MGDRHRLALQYLSAPEEAKNEARRLLWGDCGSWPRFDKALQEVAKRGWANADGVTESGRQRLARYPDVPALPSPPMKEASFAVAVVPVVPPPYVVEPEEVVVEPVVVAKPKRIRKPAKKKATKGRKRAS